MSRMDAIGIMALSFASGWSVFEFVKAYLLDIKWFKDIK